MRNDETLQSFELVKPWLTQVATIFTLESVAGGSLYPHYNCTVHEIGNAL